MQRLVHSGYIILPAAYKSFLIFYGQYSACQKHRRRTVYAENKQKNCRRYSGEYAAVPYVMRSSVQLNKKPNETVKNRTNAGIVLPPNNCGMVCCPVLILEI